MTIRKPRFRAISPNPYSVRPQSPNPEKTQGIGEKILESDIGDITW